ncbi:kinase-like protein [Rickenella mellea]|uniref:Kinase-like protein n=1 Tax=Rickenella mellea TaxID=50990 RepID=A0A4Y7PKI1_9AGAM|nr:kinase-like protein [Rickenella mellea]
MNGKAYVAKRFWEIGDGPEKVSRQKNADNLVAEFKRIKQAAWFLSQFCERAKEIGVEIAQAKEDPADLETSPASATAIEWDNAQPPFWLIEPLRSSSITRYNGTLVHAQLPGKIGQTILAFVHYVYLASKRDMVLADIQSELNITGEFLFDIMTHTKSGLSGVGDHGKTGITAFVRQHVCQDICKNLGFRNPMKKGTGNKGKGKKHVVEDDSDESDSGGEDTDTSEEEVDQLDK